MPESINLIGWREKQREKEQEALIHIHCFG